MKMNILNKNSNDPFINQNQYIFNKYKVLKNIGLGSSGKVYSVINIKDKNKYAMKTERIIPNKKSRLKSEAFYLQLLQGFGFPKLISLGHNKIYNILIETLLGKSLYSIYIKNDRKCSIKDMAYIAIQILERLHWIHSKGIIYRDVKPENFMTEIKDPNLLYVIDFGLCKLYKDSKTGKHIKFKNTGKFNGTLKFASANVVMGHESSRRDDLISLGYMLIFLLKLELPWGSFFKDLSESEFYEVVNIKKTNNNGKLLKNLPKELVEYINYTSNLKFEEEPNYPYLKYLFNKLLFTYNINSTALLMNSKSQTNFIPNGKGIENYKDNEKESIKYNDFLKEKLQKNRIVKNYGKNRKRLIPNRIMNYSIESFKRKDLRNKISSNTSLNKENTFHLKSSNNLLNTINNCKMRLNKLFKTTNDNNVLESINKNEKNYRRRMKSMNFQNYCIPRKSINRIRTEINKTLSGIRDVFKIENSKENSFRHRSNISNISPSFHFPFDLSQNHHIKQGLLRTNSMIYTNPHLMNRIIFKNI